MPAIPSLAVATAKPFSLKISDSMVRKNGSSSIMSIFSRQVSMNTFRYTPWSSKIVQYYPGKGKDKGVVFRKRARAAYNQTTAMRCRTGRLYHQYQVLQSCRYMF